MYPVSAGFAAAALKSHTAIFLAEVCDTDGVVLAELKVTGGNVSASESSAIRRTCSVTLVDPTGDLVPEVASDLLHPSAGRELRLYRGISHSSEELIPLGVFRMSRPKFSDYEGGLQIHITGYDRAKKIQRNRWTDPYTVEAGTNVATAVRSILLDRLDQPEPNLMVTTRTTPTTVFGLERENDPWSDLTSLAAAIGAEVFFDAAGIAVMRPVPDANVDPEVLTFTEGASATLIGLERDLDEERTYNGVIVTGEGAGVASPVRAEAWDTNTQSPTYYLGDYGKVPYFFHSPLITTTEQAQDAADATLRRVLSSTELLSISAVPNPALEPGDVVRVERDRLHVSAAYVVSSLTIPLTPEEPMKVSTRQRRAL